MPIAFDTLAAPVLTHLGTESSDQLIAIVYVADQFHRQALCVVHERANSSNGRKIQDS